MYILMLLGLIGAGIGFFGGDDKKNAFYSWCHNGYSIAAITIILAIVSLFTTWGHSFDN